MKRVKLTVAYDGTNYCGWQIQPNGLTVQEVLNRACSDLLREEIRTMGASRTDAGVHAEGQIAVFDTAARMPAGRMSFALNTYLPEDIRVVDSREVPSDFHPRYTETVKTYTYRILNRTFPDPLRRLYSMHCYDPLDFEAMRMAAGYLIGEHDFRSFQASGSDDEKKSTVRTIYRADLSRADDMITFRITGNGFLYHMVRVIVGTLLEIGRGRMRPEEMERIILARDRSAAGPTAIAKGLTLVSIRYPEWEREDGSFRRKKPAGEGEQAEKKR